MCCAAGQPRMSGRQAGKGSVAGWRGPSATAWTARTPFRINLAAGAFAAVAASALATAAFGSVSARLTVMALAVVGYASAVADGVVALTGVPEGETHLAPAGHTMGA